MMINKLKQIASLLTCFLMILAVAINYRGKAFGHDIQQNQEKVNEETITQDHNGIVKVSTINIAKDIKGYGGTIPLQLYINNGELIKIEVLSNAETPDFLERVKQELFPLYIGKSVDEIANLEVNVVSGATLSSNALIETINHGVS